MKWTHGMRARLGLLRRDAAEARMDDEIRFHIEMETEKNVRAGMSPEEARRRAVLAFGGVEAHKEEMREGRTLGWAGGVSLDVKLGVRMLRKYPGLTLVATLALAVAIALGSLYFEALNKWQNPRLPIADADRVVSIRLWDAKAFGEESRSLNDFASWRDGLRTVQDLGAAIVFVRNLATPDRRVEPVRGAEISASAFRVMGTVPLLGRALTEQDERPGEPLVVVIGYSLWQTRFAGDPAVVGRPVEVGTAGATIVGVMPEGFAFPVSERIWMPLRLDGSLVAPRTGPGVSVFGRLAPGVSLRQAQAELDAVGRRAAAATPETHADLRPRVTGYARPLADGGQGQLITRLLYLVNGVFLMLLAIVSANVATLVFARTATRGWEITVRSALGASRARIVTQLFFEALVLVGVGAIAGLAVAKLSLRWGLGMLGGGGNMPFWIDDSLSLKTVLYTAVLTLVGAAIIGILPALRLTRTNVQDALRSEGAARSGLRFGGFWTAVIVGQVAITVALMPLAAGGVFESNRFRQRAEGIGAERYLTASIAMDREDYGTDSADFANRGRQSLEELARRLSAEPGVERVTFADRLPVMDQFKYSIDVDTTLGAPASSLRRSTLVQVSPGFFATFGTTVVAGRDFAPLDFETGRVVIVNESFARYVFQGRNPIGQRVRIVGGEDESLAGEEYYEVVGMVRDFGWQLPLPHEQSAIYRPRLPLPGQRLSLAMRVRDPDAFAPRLRSLATEVDPTIRLSEVQPLTDVGGGEAKSNWALTAVAWLIASIVLLLSATGIHSLMSFTVARRTREIGIRAALGAPPRRIVASIFARAFVQVSVGILVGTGAAALLGVGSARDVLLLVGADALMMSVGLAACIVPLRRALRIDPMEALRADG